MAKQPTEKEQLVRGWKARIRMHEKQLAALRADNKRHEANMVKKIKLERIQLNALTKKSK